jgi:hypothetical protein
VIGTSVGRASDPLCNVRERTRATLAPEDVHRDCAPSVAGEQGRSKARWNCPRTSSPGAESHRRPAPPRLTQPRGPTPKDHHVGDLLRRGAPERLVLKYRRQRLVAELALGARALIIVIRSVSTPPD